MTGKHVVRQGEYLSLIAAKYGFSSWRTIYDHSDNSEFRKKRPNPNIIHPGDELMIPSLENTVVFRQTGQFHKFVVRRPKPDELIVVLRRNGSAIAGEDCDVEFSDDSTTGLQTCVATTSPSGELRVPIVKGATRARIVVKKRPWLMWNLAIGHLDPMRDAHLPYDIALCRLTGIQARLNNLGFFCGKVDGIMGAQTQAAIKAFQHLVLGREEPDGELDEETCGRLEAAHGC